MPRFRYLCDPLFLVGCAAYAVNRWLVKPHLAAEFVQFYFNDLWLIPCALPPVLWLHRRLNLRSHDDLPSISEIAWHLVMWSVICEWIGPEFVSHTSGDWMDVVAYTSGAVLAGLWWQGRSWFKHSNAQSFDRLAPIYRWMEVVLAGGKLHRCRTAYLKHIPAPQTILMLGEGHGRSLIECRRQFPAAHITCVDSSQGMIAQARHHLQRHGLDAAAVQFIHTDVLTWTPPSGAYDLIVTHFFLDCFRPDQLDVLMPKLASASAPHAHWLIADFQLAKSGWRRLRSRLILWGMYRFFRVATRLPARELTPPDPFMLKAGFSPLLRVETEWSLLKSEWWRRSASPPLHQD